MLGKRPAEAAIELVEKDALPEIKFVSNPEPVLSESKVVEGKEERPVTSARNLDSFFKKVTPDQPKPISTLKSFAKNVQKSKSQKKEGSEGKTVQIIKSDSKNEGLVMEKESQPVLKFTKMSNSAQKEQSREHSYVDPSVEI